MRWPAIARLAVGTSATDDESMFATRWLRGQLALLTPPRAGEAGAGVPQLARVIQHSIELFSHVIVDLTGFKKLGEHLAAIEMMDGVIVVARAGRTTENELLRLNHEMPRHLEPRRAARANAVTYCANNVSPAMSTRFSSGCSPDEMRS